MSGLSKQKQIVLIFYWFFQLSTPHFFSLQGFYQIHDAYKNKKQRTGKTKDGYVFGAVEFIHGPAQPFCNEVHAGHHHEGEKEGEDETKNNGPA